MKKFSIFIFSLSVAIFFYGCQSNYEKGVVFLKEDKYEKALTEFQKINKGDKDFLKSESKINYTRGLIELYSGDYDLAMQYFTKVDVSDDYKIKANEKIEYTRVKKDYIKAKSEFENKNYSNVIALLKNVRNDYDFYKEAMILKNDASSKQKEFDDKQNLDATRKLQKIETLKKFEIGRFVPNTSVLTLYDIINSTRYDSKDEFEKIKKITFKEIIPYSKFERPGYNKFTFTMPYESKERVVSEYSDLWDWQNPYGGKGMHFLLRQTTYLEYENFILFLPDEKMYNIFESNPNNYYLCFVYRYEGLNSIEPIDNDQHHYIKSRVTGAYILDKNKNVVFIDRQYEK